MKKLSLAPFETTTTLGDKVILKRSDLTNEGAHCDFCKESNKEAVLGHAIKKEFSYIAAVNPRALNTIYDWQYVHPSFGQSYKKINGDVERSVKYDAERENGYFSETPAICHECIKQLAKLIK